MPFGRYRLGRIIGEGGMGRVYEAFDTVTDRTVAVKVLPEGTATNHEFRERFRREAHAAARLSEPHIVPIHDYGEIDGHLFLDMRLIDGVDLSAVLTREGPMPPARAVHLIEQIAAALDAAHAAGLVHRDVKPSNILLGDRDFAYLIDFGIARNDADTAMTSIGTTLGTFAYMAPERFTPGQPSDARADVYSLACVLYECLTGTRPFPGTSAPEQIAAHLTAAPPRPGLGGNGAASAFDDVIARGMAKLPDERYTRAGEFAAAARQALGAASHVPDGGHRPSANFATVAAPAPSSVSAPVLSPAPTWSSAPPTVLASHGPAAPEPDRGRGIGGLATACLAVVCGMALLRLIGAAASYDDQHAITFADYWLPVLSLVSAVALAIGVLILRRRSLVIAYACLLLVAWLPMSLGDWESDVLATAFGVTRALGLMIVFVILAVLMGVGAAAHGPRRRAVTGPGGFADGAAQYASWGARFGAALLDGVPAGMLAGLGMVIMRATSTAPSADNPSGGSSGGGGAIMALCYAAALAYLVWNVGFRQGTTGQTWGKKIVGISVIGMQSGVPLGVGTSIGRQLAHIVDALPCYLGFLFPLWDPKAQTLADKMIGSVVVRGAVSASPHPAVPGPHSPATGMAPQAAAADPRLAPTEIAAPVAAAPVVEGMSTVGNGPRAAVEVDAHIGDSSIDPRLAVTELAENRSSAPGSAHSPVNQSRTELVVGAAVLAVVAVVGVAVAVTQAESRSGEARVPAIIDTIDVPTGAREIAVDPNSHTAYVTGYVGKPVSVIDIDTNTVVATIPVGPEPSGVAIDAGRATLYVTDRTERTVRLIDSDTRKEVATIPVGYDPQSVIIDPGSPMIYVIGGSDVTVIDTGTRTAIATIPVEYTNRKAALDPDTDTLYVAADRDLAMIDTSTNTVTGSLAIPTYDSPNPLDVAVDPITHTVYVTAYDGEDSDTRTLSIIDPNTRAVLAAPVADGNALDIALDASDHTVYVANYTDVQVIDTQQRTHLGSIDLVAGHSAEDIAVDTTTHTVYVADGESVLVIGR
ncbi:protein kinase domain-containing protein [Nocardia cyriacigeorgica]|uniref:protein kinase domain-containing protein n=1 Tax=Nocardia cyriacigeorgica TaxID=135487 RepID=UPI00245884D4|nr:protein kinase [Nocardia cyriacigeorgica]